MPHAVAFPHLLSFLCPSLFFQPAFLIGFCSMGGEAINCDFITFSNIPFSITAPR